MTNKPAIALLSILAASFSAFGAASADIVVGTRFREAHTQTTTFAQNDDHGTTNSSGGSYFGAPSSFVSDVSLGAFTASAFQNSSIPSLTGASMSGAGSANGAATVGPAQNGNGSINTDSAFDVKFTVDAVQTYDFSATVTYNGNAAIAPGTALVWLHDLTTMAPLFYLQKSSADNGSISTAHTVTLNPGRTYRLYAVANIAATVISLSPQIADAQGLWNFSLTPAANAVPETSAFVPTSAAAGLVALSRRLSRRK